MVEEVALMATYIPGKSLAPLPAASYERMLAAGMPTGGVDVFSRTLAEQTALWKAQRSRGITAAFPSRNAPHVAGRAFDTQTTRDGKYVPSGAHLWLCEGGTGSVRIAGERIRANNYGWVRTVPGERWHFAYDIDLDRVLWKIVQTRLGVTADGIPGPKTKAALKSWQKAHGLVADGIPGAKTLAGLNATKPPASKPDPKPEPPEPPKPGTVRVSIGVANCQSYDGDKSASAWKARARLMAAQKWAVVVVCETTEAGREVMRAELSALTGNPWKVLSLASKSVGVLFDSSVAKWRPTRKAGPWTPFGHGTLACPFVIGGIGLDVLSHHTPPASVASDAVKDKRISQGAALAGKWPAIMAGDFARNVPPLPGWTRATPRVDSMDRSGNQSVDAAFVRGAVSVASSKVVDPGRLSDHKWLGVDLILGQSVPTN